MTFMFHNFLTSPRYLSRFPVPVNFYSLIGWHTEIRIFFPSLFLLVFLAEFGDVFESQTLRGYRILHFVRQILVLA